MMDVEVMLMAGTDGKRKRRLRKRTKAIRTELKNLLEVALCASNYRLLKDKGCFAGSTEDGQLLYAPLTAVLRELNAEERFATLSKEALCSVSNIAKLFKIALASPAQDGEELQMIVDSTKLRQVPPADRTVYVDNLPTECTLAQLRSRAESFGTVVEIKLPIVPRIQQQQYRRNKAQLSQSTHSGFGFVEFVSKSAAQKFTKAYTTASWLKPIKQKGRRKARTTLHASTKTSETPPASFDTASSSMTADSSMEAEQILAPSTHKQMTSESPSAVHVEAEPRGDYYPEMDTRPTTINTTPDVQMDAGQRAKVALPKRKRKRLRSEKRINTRQTAKQQIQPSSAQMLRRMHVYSMREYLQLRGEYMNLKKDAMTKLKQSLKGAAAMQQQQQELSQQQLAQRASACMGGKVKPNSIGEPTAGKKRKHRSRGRERMLERTFAIKEMSVASMMCHDSDMLCSVPHDSNAM